MALRLLLAFLATCVHLVAQSSSNGPVAVEMRGVNYHFTDTVSVYISRLQGELLPLHINEMAVFDDKNSFSLAIRSAEISMPLDSLTNVLNTYVFASSNAPLKNLSVTADSNRLKIKGKLHEYGDIPFEAEGSLSATSDGKILLHTENVHAAHLPVKGIMDLLGIKLAKLIQTQQVRGIEARDNDLYLDPQQILPPPHIRGSITHVEIRGNTLVQVFGAAPDHPVTQMSGNYMGYRGNHLRFGKLTMDHTDLILIDMDSRDPFDFSLERYQQQLVAGYTHITKEFGLRVYMPDLNKLSSSKTKRR
jgi:hypothetical protein